MTPTRPRISPKVLAELARKVHPELVTDDGKPVHRTFFSTAQHWAVLLIVGAWAVMLLVAPLLLLLLLVRVNYTAHWLVSAFWLLGISFVVGGLLMIADWIEQYIHRKPRDDTALLAGIGIVITILIIGFLLWQGANDVIHPLVTFGLMALFSTLFVVWGIYRLIADRQTRLVVRVVYLLAMLCLGAGLLIASISLNRSSSGSRLILTEHCRKLVLYSHPWAGRCSCSGKLDELSSCHPGAREPLSCSSRQSSSRLRL
jgi:hypothetical protein